MSRAWSRRGGSSASIPPEPMLELARATAGPVAGDRLSLIRGTVADAPKGPFDAGTCILVLGLVPDDAGKLALLKGAQQRLRPGAPFILVDQCIDRAAADPAQAGSLCRLRAPLRYRRCGRRSGQSRGRDPRSMVPAQGCRAVLRRHGLERLGSVRLTERTGFKSKRQRRTRVRGKADAHDRIDDRATRAVSARRRGPTRDHEQSRPPAPVGVAAPHPACVNGPSTSISQSTNTRTRGESWRRLG